MEVFAYGSDLSLTVNGRAEAACTADKVRETFVATLCRITSNLQIISTDNSTSNADAVRITYSACGKSFNPLTGLATFSSGIVNTVYLTYPTGQPAKINSYSFLNADQQFVDIGIDVFDGDGNSVSHKVVSNVPFQRNKVTQLHGVLYSAGVSGSFTINTYWLGDTNTVNF